MQRVLFTIIAGLVLAILAAGLVAFITGLPLAGGRISTDSFLHFVKLALPVAAFGLPAGLLALLLADQLRWRSLYTWLVIGLLLGFAGYLLMSGPATAPPSARSTNAALLTSLLMGLAGGFVYWLAAGKHSGHLGTGLKLASDGSHDELSASGRCTACLLTTLLLGLIPFGLLGATAVYRGLPAPAAFTETAETDARTLLGNAGLSWASLKIEDQTGRLTGVAPDVAAQEKALASAKEALKPMLGMFGIVNVLKNDTTVLGAPAAVVAPAEPAAPAP